MKKPESMLNEQRELMNHLDMTDFPLDEEADIIESKDSNFWGIGSLIITGNFSENEVKVLRYMYQVREDYLYDIAIVLRREYKSIEHKIRQLKLKRSDC